jgi:2-amino-4-hydroxy-6-hydroxymethyldihydropteridine diphosphokinase
MAQLGNKPCALVTCSAIIETAPVGPSLRRYANAAVVIKTQLNPPELLLHLKAMERQFGRRKRGQRWGARTLDLDIILWSGGIWTGRDLFIPHPAFRARNFVLKPLNEIASLWRDPISGRTIRQLLFRAVKRPILEQS